MAGGRLATRAEAVAALGLPSARALDRLIERGAPRPAPGPKGSARYDLDAIAAWRASRPGSPGPGEALATERAKLAKVQRQLAALKLRQARGELVPAGDAEQALATIVTATRASLLSVPRRAVLAGLPREHEALVHGLITEALRELSEARSARHLAAVGRAEVA